MKLHITANKHSTVQPLLQTENSTHTLTNTQPLNLLPEAGNITASMPQLAKKFGAYKGWTSDSRTFAGSVADGYLATATNIRGTLGTLVKEQRLQLQSASPKIIPIGTSVIMKAQ